jgi:hypothetical protein
LLFDDPAGKESVLACLCLLEQRLDLHRLLGLGFGRAADPASAEPPGRPCGVIRAGS